MTPAHLHTVGIFCTPTSELNRCALVGNIMRPEVLQDRVTSPPCHTTRDSSDLKSSHRHIIELPSPSPIPLLIKRICVVPSKAEIHRIAVRSVSTDTHLTRAGVVQPRRS